MPAPPDPILSTFIPRRTVAKLLNLTPLRIDNLVTEGILSRHPKGFVLQDAVHEYITFCKGERKDNGKAATANRAQAARAAEIEARMAREARTVIELEEAMEHFDGMTGEFVQTLGSLPARITRDPRERQRLESIIDTERLRLSDHFAQRASALQTGEPIAEAETTEDTGSMGAGE